jgi:hypothetical protein
MKCENCRFLSSSHPPPASFIGWCKFKFPPFLRFNADLKVKGLPVYKDDGCDLGADKRDSEHG